MCCLVTTLLLVGPRLAILVWWFMDSTRLRLAFQAWPHPLDLAFPLWVWPLVGAIFVPWTTLAYLYVFPGGVVGQEWLWLGLGLLVDITSHSGGAYRNRNRIPGYSR